MECCLLLNDTYYFYYTLYVFNLFFHVKHYSEKQQLTGDNRLLIALFAG